MKRILMLTDGVGGNGEALEAGRVYELEDASADHWLKRKKAELADGSADDDVDSRGESGGDSGGGDRKPPSEGLTVAQIKDALAERGIAIPDGVTLKAELAELLDQAAPAD